MKNILVLLYFLFVFESYAQNRWDTINPQSPEVGQMLKVPIYFDLDKPGIRYDAAIVLKKLLPLLTAIDSAVYTIEFYTDCRSSAEYNKDLSKRRADSTAAYLYRLSGGTLNIKPLGMGESHPLNDCICDGNKRQIYTRYTEDTVNGVPQHRKVYYYDSTHQLVEYSREEIEQHIKNGDYFLTCSESEHQRNRRSIIRLIAFRKHQ